jgi:hypothetical protein
MLSFCAKSWLHGTIDKLYRMELLEQNNKHSACNVVRESIDDNLFVNYLWLFRHCFKIRHIIAMASVLVPERERPGFSFENCER